ncbi:hypothetical protein H311_02130 [Anncaliia algerae PRA109]|nr:hypothetical protein H311_02130 [Anncaliia algerae PRA109]
MSRIENLNKKRLLNAKSKLAALYSTIQNSFAKKINIKEGSTFLKLYKKYKNHFKYLIHNKPLKKKLSFEEKLEIKSNDIFFIDKKITYKMYKKRPFLVLNMINESENDICIFCLNSFENLKEHLKEEINNFF